MGKYQGYEKYKDSGVEWLGKIPQHWEVKQLKYIKSIDKNAFVDGPFGSNLKTVHFVTNGDAFVIESEFATRGKLVEEELKQITQEHFSTIQRSSAKSGDIIIAKIGAYFGLNNILPNLSKPAVVSGNSLKLSVNTNTCCTKFIHYLLLHLKQSGAIDLQVSITAQPALSLGGMNRLQNSIPPLDEQKSIARFLDYKTKQIDDLIAKKEALIGKLDEKRTALISHAVTKGLDPNVPMKDSGVEWLGAIPEHWNLARIKYYADCFNGSTPSTTNTDYWDDGEIPWLSSGKVNEEIVTQPSAYISPQALRECSLKIAPKGSVIVGIVGQGKTRGLSAYLGINTTINQNMVAIVPYKNLEGRFLYFFLKQAYTSIRNLGRGANQPALDVGLVNRFPIVIPPASEQQKIVTYLDEQEKTFFAISQKVQQAIDRLKEYRTALITNAVTGKIDVRQVLIP